MTAALIIASISSPSESGGIRKSTIVPWILPDRNEKLALANAFCIMPMTISPGATKVAKLTPSTSRPPLPRAIVKITRNSRVVIAGAQIVWVCTLKKRRTSFIYSVLSPTQLNRWITGSPLPGKT